MARKLPWAVNDAPAAKRSRPSPSDRPKRSKEPSPNSIEEEGTLALPSNRGRASQSNVKKDSSFRTPSTSPVRAPPSVQLMRTGYDKDDIYIMVEDEFQSVAQSYTAHLHHAEYKRLMREARTAPSKNLPEPTSPMSKEAKQRLQSAALHRRQSDVLHQVAGKVSTGQDEEDKISDLWSGTSLAPLMAQGSQQKTSLVGLERILSTTRASSGYSRPKSSGGHFRGEELDDRDDTSVGHSNYSQLDGRAQPAQRVSDSTNQKFPPRSTVVATQKRTKNTLPSTSSIHDVDDETADGESSVLRKKKPKENRTRPKAQTPSSDFLKRKRDKEKEKQSRLDEVPLFII